MHNGVELFVEKSPSELKKVMLQLRQIILSCSPNIEEKISYGVPYYYYMGPMCYFHITKLGALQVGFAKGTFLQDPFGVLEEKGRSVIKSIDYFNTEEIVEEHIRFFIQESIIINSEKRKR